MDPPLHVQLELDQLLHRLADLRPGTAIVDFGAGSGRVSVPLLQRGYQVTAVDISPEARGALEEFVRGRALGPLETATRLPADDRFTAIVGADVLHHVALDEVLAELYRSLAPGGRIVFSEPGAWHPAWYVVVPLLSSWSVERGILACSLPSLRRRLALAGFRRISVTGLGALPLGTLNWWPAACRANLRAGNLPLLRPVAYRYLIQGWKVDRPAR